MTRLAPSLAAAIATLMLAAPALAADYSNSFDSDDSSLRSGFSEDDWANSDKNDPLSFELGLRYWYSWGAQKFNVSGAALTDDDNAQSVEAHFRIDDSSSKFYAKGLAGTAFSINGSATDTALSTSTAVTDGHIGYAGADLGYSWLGDNKAGAAFGPFAGYMYWDDSPNLGRANFTTGTTTADFTYDPSGGLGNEIIGPGNSTEDSVAINALRLGFSGKMDLGTLFDVSGELAAVPYAKIGGTLGAFGVPTYDDGKFSRIQSSAATIDGWGYGAMGEVMVGFHPTDSWTFRVGGRAWYLQGRADTTFNTVTVTDANPATVVGTQEYISTANPWSLLRYGALAEMTYKF